MAFFKKKPVVIEAHVWDGSSECLMFMQRWLDASFQGEVNKMLTIFTLEGTHDASVGDMIIKGVKGEFYPCKPDIFDMTYEEVNQ